VWGLGGFPMSWVIRGCLIYEISIWIYVRLMDIEGGHVMRTRFNYLSTVRQCMLGTLVICSFECTIP
jgi:hypothetical protein